MTWDVYGRSQHRSVEFVAMQARLRGWHEIAPRLHPAQANALRAQLGIHTPDSQVKRPHEEVFRLARLLYLQARAWPCSHPADEGKWRLDQDRRCKDGDWACFT